MESSSLSLQSVFETLDAAFTATDPAEKVDLTYAAYEAALVLGEHFSHPGGEWSSDPGRPEKPPLVHYKQLHKRRIGTPEGRAALWHAIAHIEFNAINLALDALLRFDHMPHEYYVDWMRVAKEEAYHFSLIASHLRDLGSEYGAFNAHNSLWDMAHDTRGDCLARMCLVPRVLEARGLDVTPSVMEKLMLAGDTEAERILSIILRDEIGHVAVGNRWFRHLCHERGLEPLSTFETLTRAYLKGQLKGPYSREKRLEAGFESEELDWLETHYP